MIHKIIFYKFKNMNILLDYFSCVVYGILRRVINYASVQIRYFLRDYNEASWAVSFIERADVDYCGSYRRRASRRVTVNWVKFWGAIC